MNYCLLLCEMSPFSLPYAHLLMCVAFLPRGQHWPLCECMVLYCQATGHSSPGFFISTSSGFPSKCLSQPCHIAYGLLTLQLSSYSTHTVLISEGPSVLWVNCTEKTAFAMARKRTILCYSLCVYFLEVKSLVTTKSKSGMDWNKTGCEGDKCWDAVQLNLSKYLLSLIHIWRCRRRLRCRSRWSPYH